MPTATRPDVPADTTVRTVLTYVVLVVLLGLSWAGEFVAFVIVSFGFSSCGTPDPSEVAEGRLLLAATAGVAGLVWGGLWWLTGRRTGAAVVAVLAVLPAVGCFLYGMVDSGFWADGFCF